MARLKMAGCAAALGAVGVGVGELLMHWTGELGVSGSEPYGFLLEISRERLLTGHFLAMLFAPLYFLGYWQVSQRLFPVDVRARRLFLGASFFTLSLALVWIGSQAFLARSLQLAGGIDERLALSAEYDTLLEPLIWGLRIGMAGLSLRYAIWVAKRQTSYPRWMAWANPFLFMLLVFGTLSIPFLGPHLVPAAFNVAHLPFFLLSALVPFVERVDADPCDRDLQ